MSTIAMTSNTPTKKPAPLAFLLAFIFALFIGILVFCYVVTKRANPIFTDEHGKPITEHSEPAHH